jgi:putative NADH-flavin reductase
MKVVIFGATGRTGVHLVREALGAGHTVTIFVRNAAKAATVLGGEAGRVSMLTGSVQDGGAVAAAVAGQDAVLNALGHAYGETDPTWMTSATRAMLAGISTEAARRGSPLRLVDMTGVVNWEPQDGTVVWFSVMRGFLSLFKRTVLDDHTARTALIKAAPASAVAYTIVRPPYLTDGPRTGVYRLFAAASSACGSSISRADVAHFMVAALANNTWVGKLPIISY